MHTSKPILATDSLFPNDHAKVRTPPDTTGWLARALIALLRWWARNIWKVRTSGWEHLPEKGGVMIVANHSSYADAVLLSATSPRPLRFIGSAGLRRHFWMRWVFRTFAVIPVSPLDAYGTVRKAAAALRRGEVVVVFPEGHVSTSGHLLPFQKGAHTIARLANVLILPIGITYNRFSRADSFRRWLERRHPKFRHPLKACLRVGTPLNPRYDTMEDVRDAVIDAGYEAFLQTPGLDDHLAARAVRDLKKHLSHKHVVDLATGRKELTSGMILAVALTMAERWKTLIPEQRVGVVFPSGLGAILTNLALTLLGKTPINLNFTAGRDANDKCIRRARIKTVITAAPVKAKVPDFPWPENTIDLIEERKTLKKSRVIWNLAKIHLLPAEALIRHYNIPTEGGEIEATILFSSGSTGDPKGVVLTHRNIVGNCMQIEQCNLLDQREKMLACLPTFHSFGYTVTLWYPLLSGLRIVCLPSPLETKRNAEAIRDEQITVMMGTPTFFRPYFKRVPKEWLESLNFVVGGAEKTPEGLHDQWEQTFGSQYLEGYGLTETSPVLCANLPYPKDGENLKRVGSVGKLFPGIKGRIIDPESGKLLKRGQLGILEVQGVNVFRGYLDDAYATHACFRDGWFVTGDLARFDEEGFLYIEGRLSRFSKIGGEMVPHGTVENEINHAFEFDQSEVPVVAVAGISHPSKGEALVLLTSVDLDLDQVRQRLSAKGLPNLWIPRKMVRVEEIPCLASGKLDLRAISDIARDAED